MIKIKSNPQAPREHHLDEVRQKKVELQKITGRVDTLWRIFEKSKKKMKLQDRKT